MAKIVVLYRSISLLRSAVLIWKSKAMKAEGMTCVKEAKNEIIKMEAATSHTVLTTALFEQVHGSLFSLEPQVGVLQDMFHLMKGPSLSQRTLIECAISSS